MILWVLLFIAVCVVVLVVLIVLARDGLQAIATFKQVGTELGLSFSKSNRDSGQMPSISGDLGDVPVSAQLQRETDEGSRRGLYVVLRAELAAHDTDDEAEQQAASELEVRFDHHTLNSNEVITERWNTTLEADELRDDLLAIADIAERLNCARN